MNLLALLGVLPNMINAVETIVGAFPGKGAVKKEMVMSGLQALVAGAQSLGVKIDPKVLQDASKYIDGYVALQNAAGAFDMH